MINKAAVFHRAFGNYAYYRNNKDVYLMIRTAKNDITKVVCEYYDKYDYNKRYTVEMQKRASCDVYDYYTTVITPPHRRLCYFFRLYKGKKEFIYKQYGFTTSAYPSDFQLAYLNPCDVFEIPSWINNSVFYQIFPDAFSTYGRTTPLSKEYYGGTLKGITKNISYLKELGINLIYLNPIFTSTTYHRYDITDYYSIDPTLGTEQDFRDLVNTCHKNGIRIILDAVLNHSSSNHPMFLDVLKNGKKSKYINYYVINSFKGNKINEYDRFAFENYMPKLNTSNLETQKYLIDILTYWIKEFDIDGWRFDVANEIGHAFIKKIRTAIKEVKPEAFMLGEIWHDGCDFLLGDEYDGITNFTLKDLLFEYIKDNVSAKHFAEKLNRYLSSLPQQAITSNSNFLCNHDTHRIASEIKDKNTLMSLIAIQFIFPGTPLIYYGEEIGMEHHPEHSGDKGARSLMEFDKVKNNELFEFYKKMIRLKTKNVCLSSNDYNVESINDLLVIIRQHNNKQVKLIVNTTNKDKKIKLEGNYKNYLTNQQYNLGDKIKVLNNNFVILVKD